MTENSKDQIQEGYSKPSIIISRDMDEIDAVATVVNNSLEKINTTIYVNDLKDRKKKGRREYHMI